MTKRDRKVRLCTERTEDKVWAAVVALGGYAAWVSIDALGDFLRMRQHDASAVKFDEKDPNTRYALQPKLTKWTRGWEDHIIAHALNAAVEHGFLEHARHEDLNVFRAKKDPDSLWKLMDTSVPTSPAWALPRVAS